MVSHIFWPVISYSVACLSRRGSAEPVETTVALVVIALTSEPQPGSLIENAPRTSPVAIRGRYFCFCSSVPCCSSM